MDYNSLLQQSQRELEDLSKKEAVLQESIKTTALQLGLTVDEHLESNIAEKRQELEEKIKQGEVEVERLTNELSELNLSTDD